MSSIAKPRLTYQQAHNFLQNVIIDAVDDFKASRIDPADFADFIARTHKAKFVEYVKSRCDWPSIATDDALVSADDARACYENPEKFRTLVDDALFRHFQTVLEDWQLTVKAILVRVERVRAA